MTTYVYKAKNRTTQTVSGQINAQSQEEAVELINQLGLLPISVVEQTVETAVSLSKPQKISSKELTLFSRQMANLIRSGVPLLRSIEILLDQNQNNYFKSVIRSIFLGIKNGRSFSNCLGDFPQIFSPLYVAMVYAGEEGGNLREMLENLASYHQKQQEIISRVRTALAYPVLMGFVGIGTVVFILTFVLPKMSGLFENLGKDLPLPTVILLAVSSFMVKYWFWMLLGILAVAITIERFLKTAAGRKFVSHFAINAPFFGSLILKVELARFARTLELSLKSGLSILKALQVTAPVISNDIVRDIFIRSRNQLIAGGSFAATLRQTKELPIIFGHMIAVGEESGNLSEVLGDVANAYEQESDEQIKVLMSLLEPAMILIIGSVVGFIVFSILLPIFQVDALAR